MQETMRQALTQRARLAALGTAVTKVNHDLRNILSTARLVSDQLAENRAPEVRRAAASVLAAIDRAANAEGISANQWLVRAASMALQGPPAPPRSTFGKNFTGFAQA